MGNGLRKKRLLIFVRPVESYVTRVTNTLLEAIQLPTCARWGRERVWR
jgi:hypothetical protein